METFLVIFGILGCVFGIGFNIWAWCWDVPNTLEKERELERKVQEWDARVREELK